MTTTWNDVYEEIRNALDSEDRASFLVLLYRKVLKLTPSQALEAFNDSQEEEKHEA